MVVNELLLRVWQLEELGEDSVDGHVLRLPRRLWRLNIAQLIERCGSCRKSPRGKVAVQVDQMPRGDVAVEMENVDRIQQCIPNQRRSGIRQRRHRLDVLVGIYRQVDFGEQRPGPGNHRLGDGNSRQGMLSGILQLRLLCDLAQGELPRPRQAGQRPLVVRLALELALQQPNHTLGLGRVLLTGLGVVRVDERLQSVRFRGDNLRLLHQIRRLLCPLPRSSDHDVGKRQENDLDNLRANRLPNQSAPPKEPLLKSKLTSSELAVCKSTARANSSSSTGNTPSPSRHPCKHPSSFR